MIQPLHNNILVEPVQEQKTLVSDEPSLSCYGKVLAIGEGVNDHRIKVGDTIAFLLWGVNHVEIEGKKYYFVPDEKEFVLGKVNE